MFCVEPGGNYLNGCRFSEAESDLNLSGNESGTSDQHLLNSLKAYEEDSNETTKCD